MKDPYLQELLKNLTVQYKRLRTRFIILFIAIFFGTVINNYFIYDAYVNENPLFNHVVLAHGLINFLYIWLIQTSIKKFKTAKKDYEHIKKKAEEKKV